MRASAAVIFVVPGLEVLEIVRVNRDLDGKIARLSVWDPERNGWLSPLVSGESETASRGTLRKRLLATKHRNARWRLQAVDFFNEDLVHFLSFNNAILASIEDVIIVSDARRKVVYQNPAARRLERYTEQPPDGPNYLQDLLDGRSFSGAFDDVLNRGASAVFEFVAARNGKRYFHVALTPISKSGVVASLHDSTALFELNQAKNDMVSLVSHELRTPLTSIRGYTDMLVKYDLVSEKGRPYLSTIIEESRRLNGLIQSFLDVAYIESGRQKVTPTDFEIAPVLHDMLAILGPVAGEKQIRIEMSSDSMPVRVRADRLLLYQALSNLVTNAIKYSPSGTTVCLNVSNGNNRVRFHVADQGCGIPMEEVSKVFEKFYRRGNKETREQTGFGLGLAFVKEVAVKHGGDVVLESEVGKGSTFTLWIPQPR
jgi:two-component system phosphate regulon sensor histidine kinase PhoR